MAVIKLIDLVGSSRTSSDDAVKQAVEEAKRTLRNIACRRCPEEIAARLVLVPGTVANHVEAILNRLGFKSRTQIAVWAVERGLYRPDRAE